MTTRLLIARHGNTFAPEDTPTRVGKTDLLLVASGREQGRKLGAYLQEEGLRPVKAYTSTLQRTIGMVEEINAVTEWALPHTPLDCFDEIDYGVDENKPEAEVIARIGQDAITKWDKEAIPPQGWHVDVAGIIASWQDMATRIISEHEGQTILIVTSNGIARFAPHVLGNPQGFYAQHGMKMKTGAVSVFEYGAKGWKCDVWNHRP